MIKKLIFIFLIVTVLVISKVDASEKDVMLFIETAKLGTLHYDKKDKSYLIKLKEIDPWVIYFSNAPKRENGFMHTEEFTKTLRKETSGHEKNGLNFGLIAVDPNKEKTIRYTFTINDVTYDKLTRTIVYTARLLPGEQTSPIPSDLIFEHAALFVDGCASCGGKGF